MRKASLRNYKYERFVQLIYWLIGTQIINRRQLSDAFPIGGFESVAIWLPNHLPYEAVT